MENRFGKPNWSLDLGIQNGESLWETKMESNLFASSNMMVIFNTLISYELLDVNEL